MTVGNILLILFCGRVRISPTQEVYDCTFIVARNAKYLLETFVVVLCNVLYDTSKDGQAAEII